MLCQYPVSKIPSQSYGAECINHLVFRQFGYPVPQFVQRNIHSSRQRAQWKFILCADIQQEFVFHFDVSQFPPVGRSCSSGNNILRHVSCKSYRIFGRRERRSIRLFHFHQVVDCTFIFYHKRYFVNPLVYSVITDNLSSVQPSRFFIECDFDTHRHGIRIITGVRSRMNSRRHIVDLCLSQPFAG